MKFNDLSDWIEEHQKMLTKLLEYTNNIYTKVISQSDPKHIEFEVDNRERLITALAKIQTNIEVILGKYINQKIPLAQDQVEFIKRWRVQTEKITHELGATDEKILLAVEEFKDKTTEEISHIFKNKESFRGYNLKDVKR